MNTEEDMLAEAGPVLSEDEYYEEVAQATKKRKLDNVREPVVQEYYDDSLREGSKRSVTYQIEKNKGLTRHRPKKMRNPRVKYRLQAEKAERRLKDTGHRAVKDQKKPYSGEAGGIRKAVKRSTNLSK